MSLFETKHIRKTDQERIVDGEEQKSIDDTRALCRKICVQIPYARGEGIHGELVPMIVQWVNAGMMVMPIRDPFGGFIELTRDYMVNEFLKTDRRYLVMIDNDVVPLDPLAPILLASHNKEAVSGVACGYRPDAGVFACVAVKDDTGIARFPTRMETKVLPSQGLREVEACGTGLVCFRRDILEAVKSKEPCFALPQDVRLEAAQSGVLRLTEDTAFSYRMKQYGFKAWVDFSVHAYHDKTIPLLWGEENLDDEMPAEKFDVTRFGLQLEQK